MWGDGTQAEWVGPYNSSEVVTLSHKWNKKGTFNISAKSKDVAGYVSEWSHLEVTMPRNLAPNSPLYYFIHYLQSIRNRLANLF
jgi:hypothetical protein